MNKIVKIAVSAVVPAMFGLSQQAAAEIPGIGRVTGDTTSCSGTACNFNLTARSGHITLGDGNQLLAWGYGTGDTLQYPGPTLIVNQGDTVTVTLANTLPVPVSILFPGQEAVSASGGQGGLLTQEATAALPNGPASTPVTYTFRADHPGTYMYQSGTNPEVEIEMGLVGTLIVRPNDFNADTNRTAYNKPASAAGPSPTAYDREFLFFQTEMDRCAHEAMDAIQQATAAGTALPDASLHNPPDVCTKVDPASFKATLWFLNGRNGPDTMLKAGVAWLPLQPYNALARMHPGERVLMRIVGAGRDLHPFHHHGNNAWVIARDGRLLESSPGASAPYPDFAGINDLASGGYSLPDRSISNFTIQTVPGSTYDAIFTWTGKGLNWDIYGHSGATDCPNPPGLTANLGSLRPHEAADSHCREIPVSLPEQQALTFGGLWSGSPYIEQLTALPPLQGGLNPGGGYTFMWHSHTERELTNDDVFPGGMMTMMIIEGPSVLIDDHDNID